MNKLVLSLLVAFSGVLAFGSVLALPVGKVTRLMTKDLPDVPGKEGMVETVEGRRLPCNTSPRSSCPVG